MIGKLSGMEGITELAANFDKWAAKHKKTVVVVGFTAAYALYVHERVAMAWKGLPRKKPSKGAYWDPQGKAQAKFLEEPARTMSKELGRIVTEITKASGDLGQGLYAAGLRLQREAMLKVPVDTGNLKASAFTRKF